MRMGERLFEAHVGPRILGLTESSEALGKRAAIVEAALTPITRDALEDRIPEAMSLFARLHGDPALHEALSQDMTEADLRGYSPLANLFAETRERWFEAVVGRWLEVGLAEINMTRDLVSEVINQIEIIDQGTEPVGIIVPTHGDPNHGNFMVNRQGALRLIDFEELALNNPVADLGVFLTWYADADHHPALLAGYPLADPDAVIDRMRVWVPLRYLGIAAHWAARLTRARDQESFVFAVKSVEEWLRGACELVADHGRVPEAMTRRLEQLRESLLDRGMLTPDAEG
jgi:thiamine kinase-like enzyme